MTVVIGAATYNDRGKSEPMTFLSGMEITGDGFEPRTP